MLAIKTIQGAAWLVFSRFTGRMVDFVTLLILARILNPADFGTTAIAMSLIAIVDTVLEIPVWQALMRFPILEKSHLDTGFTIGLLRSALVALIMLIIAPPFANFYGDPNLVWLLGVLSVGLVIRGLSSPRMVIFSRDLSFRQQVYVEMIAKLFAFGLAIIVALQGGGYWAIVANFVGVSIASTVASYVLAPYWPTLTLARLADFSSFVGWLNAAQVLSALNWQFDRVLLGRFVDKGTLGKYAIATDFANLPTQSIVGPAVQPLLVAFTKLQGDQQRIRNSFGKAVRYAMLICAPLCLGISLTADLAVALLLGPKWEAAAPFLSILAVFSLGTPYIQTLHAYCLAINRPKAVFQINLVDFALRVPLISVGLYFSSVDGVVAARGVMAAIMFLVYMDFTKRIVGITIVDQLMNLSSVVIASCAMVLVVSVFRYAVYPLHLGVIAELAAVACVGAACYVGFLYISGFRLDVGFDRPKARWS